MPKSTIITALDLGTSTIKLLVASKEPGSPDINVIAQVEKPSVGIRRGVVVEPDEVSTKISQALEEVQEQIPQKINSTYVNIGGSHLFTAPAHGEVAVSRADQEVSQEDIERVILAAQTFSLPLNKEVIEVSLKEFIVDGEKVREALGMQAVKLEVEILAICAFSPYLKNLTNAVLSANLQIDDLVPSPLASARAVLAPKDKELGVAVLDIGAGTSDLAVFEEKRLIHLSVLPIGSAHITSDIAIGLKSDIELAEKLKKQFGVCFGKKVKPSSSKIHKVEGTASEPPLVFSQKLLSNIIEARLSEIFEQVEKELKNVSHQGFLPAGIVLTGGGVKIPGIIELAKKKLKLPVRIAGKPRGIAGLEQNPCLSMVCGLALCGTDFSEDQGSSWIKGMFNKLKTAFKIFVP